jgi:hypothetical protein
MSVKLTCPSCGYTCYDSGSVCPVCGKRMSSHTSARLCDAAVEEEWNGGYHDDFIEGHKTGDYCDRELENSVNGGEHYHKPAQNVSPAFTAPSAKYSSANEASVKAASIVQFVTSMFPLIGIFVYRNFRSQINRGELSDDYRKPVTVSLITAYLIKYSFIFLMFLDNFGYSFY